MRAAVLIGLATPPNPLDCGRIPKYGKWLPAKMGAGGWPIEEPTKEDVEVFLEKLSKVPSYPYFSPHDPQSADYGTQYASIICVTQWLDLLVKANLLSKEES